MASRIEQGAIPAFRRLGVMGSATMILTRERSGETIVLRKGQDVVLTLPENPTTGYRWRIAADGLDLADDQYAAGGKSSVGGGGMRRLRLVAARTGDASVTASLQRSWEDPAKAVDRRAFHFEVTGDGGPAPAATVARAGPRRPSR
jgi:inhibitor of cysteine peptidase